MRKLIVILNTMLARDETFSPPPQAAHERAFARPPGGASRRPHARLASNPIVIFAPSHNRPAFDSRPRTRKNRRNKRGDAMTRTIVAAIFAVLIVVNTNDRKTNPLRIAAAVLALLAVVITVATPAAANTFHRKRCRPVSTIIQKRV